MKGLNKVMLIGNLGSDPEVRHTSNEVAVANVSIASTVRYNGEDYTHWTRLVFWASLAEIAEKYLHKGDRLYIEGRLNNRTWEDDEGVERTVTEVVVRDMVLLSSKKDEEPEKKTSSKGKKGKDKKQSNKDDVPF